MDDLKNVGFEIKIGIEIEFTLFKSVEDGILEPAELNADSNLHSLVTYLDDFDIIYEVMHKHGIHVETIHKECSPGQFEIVIKYGEVIKTLDDYYLAKEIIA